MDSQAKNNLLSISCKTTLFFVFLSLFFSLVSFITRPARAEDISEMPPFCENDPTFGEGGTSTDISATVADREELQATENTITFKITAPDIVKKDDLFDIEVEIESDVMIDRLSLLITKSDVNGNEISGYGAGEITNEKICGEDNWSKDNCVLCGKKVFGNINKNTYNGELSNTVSSQTGTHRIVLVASNSNQVCTPSGENLSIIGFDASKTFTTVAEEETSAPTTETTTTKVQTPTTPSTGDNGGAAATPDGPGGTSGNLSSGEPVTLESGKITTVSALLNRITSFIQLAMGALVIISIIIGGIYYLTSAGNPENAEKGKKTLIYSIIAIFIMVGLYAIMYSIEDIIKGVFNLT